MSSLLAFAWRRRHQQTYPQDERGAGDPNSQQYCLPGISYSCSDTSTVVTTTDQRRGDEHGLYVARPRSVVTPDGLKSRRSMADLREELFPDDAANRIMVNYYSAGGDDDSLQETEDPNTSTVAIAPAKKEKALVQYEHGDTNKKNDDPIIWRVDEAAMKHEQSRKLMEDKQQNNLSMSVLPPRPTESWSTAGTWSSPPPTRNSSHGTNSWMHSNSHGGGSGAYGSWRTTPTAASPNLVPGRARTAVGNLVALAQQDPPGATPVNQQSDSEQQWLYSPQEKGVESMYSPMFSKESSTKNRSRSVSAHPVPHVAGRGLITGMHKVAAAHAGVQMKSTNNKRSNATAVVIREEERDIGTMYSPVLSKKNGRSNASVSTVSTTGAPQVLQSTTTVLNLAALPRPRRRTSGTEIVVSQRHLQSGTWSTTSSKGSKGRSITNSVVFSKRNSFGNALDGDIQRVKSRNQQRAKEELIIAALERLQDNAKLVTDVEGLMGTAQDMFDWYVETPMDQEGLLLGFAEKKRHSILDWLDLILQELNSDTQAEFFLSPSKTDDLSEYDVDTHEDLREALSFCKVLVQMAVPEEEKEESSLQGTADCGRWEFLPGLREALGIHQASSETPRAGDSSVFSLPTNGDVDTPMTSNVSFSASTITSFCHNTASPMNALKLKQQNGLVLRQSIQMLSTGLQKLTMAMGTMANGRSTWKGDSLVLSADQIKKSYLQMMTMNHADLKAMVDAFEFELDAEDSYEYPDDDEDSVNGGSPVLRAATIGTGTLGDKEPRETSFESDQVSQSLTMEDVPEETFEIAPRSWQH